MSTALYVAEEISEAKDGFVRYYSDDEGMTTYSYSKIMHTLGKRTFSDRYDKTISLQTTGNFYLSYVDPVVIGRRAFHSTNDFMCGVVGSFRGSLCAVVDTLLDTLLDINKGMYSILSNPI